MQRHVGDAWIGLGLFHLVVVGLTDCSDLFADMIGEGFVNTVSGVDRRADLMMFVLGIPLVLVGMALRWTQQRVGAVPESVGWAGAVAFLTAAAAFPSSGAWLIVLVSIYTIIAARRQRRTGVAGRTQAAGSAVGHPGG